MTLSMGRAASAGKSGRFHHSAFRTPTSAFARLPASSQKSGLVCFGLRAVHLLPLFVLPLNNLSANRDRSSSRDAEDCRLRDHLRPSGLGDASLIELGHRMPAGARLRRYIKPSRGQRIRKIARADDNREIHAGVDLVLRVQHDGRMSAGGRAARLIDLRPENRSQADLR